MRLPWKREVRQNDLTLSVSIKAQELDTAKEILAKVFHIRLADVEEMIQKQLEDRCWQVERQDVSARWLKASKALKEEDQVYGQRLAEMARKHSSEAFYPWMTLLKLRCFRYC